MNAKTLAAFALLMATAFAENDGCGSFFQDLSEADPVPDVSVSGDNWLQQYTNCFDNSTGNPNCDTELSGCEAVYEYALEWALEHGKEQCQESRILSVFNKLNCLKDDDGVTCGAEYKGMTNALSKVDSVNTKVFNMYEADQTAREAAGEQDNTNWQSALNQDDMESTCGQMDSCWRNTMTEFVKAWVEDSSDQNAAQLDMYFAFLKYICQKTNINGVQSYSLPEGSNALYNIFENEATVEKLDQFCGGDSRAKHSISTYLAMVETYQPEYAEFTKSAKEMMKFSCSQYNGNYCSKVLEPDDPDNHPCEGGDLDACHSFVRDKVNNGGCCVKSFAKYMKQTPPGDEGGVDVENFVKDAFGDANKFSTLKEACPYDGFEVPVEVMYPDMFCDLCESIITAIKQDIAAAAGITVDMVEVTCGNCNKDGTGVTVKGTAGVSTKDQAELMDLNGIDTTNANIAAGKKGRSVGSVSATADTANIDDEKYQKAVLGNGETNGADALFPVLAIFVAALVSRV